MARKGLLVTIYRAASHGDCTNNGVTSPTRAPKGLAILLGVPDGNYTEGALPSDLPVLELGMRAGFKHARPVGETRHVMAGGNFVHTSDTRFRLAVGDHPIAVHDRIETIPMGD